MQEKESTDADPSTKAPKGGLSYTLLGALGFTLIVGITVGLIAQNARAGAPTTFTTTELLGFILSVVLSVAATVLAFVSIALGKASERAVIERSDTSIRLLNEVFVKTTEALQRIEASTGVTEKRIEDIICGRVGTISERAAELASNAGKVVTQDPKKLQAEIQESILQSLRESENQSCERFVQQQEKEMRRHMEAEAEARYREQHDRFLRAFINRGDVRVDKFGHGASTASGLGMFDGLFKTKDSKKIALSTFRHGTAAELLSAFVARAAPVLQAHTIDGFVILAFGAQEKTLKSLQQTVSTLAPDIADRILVLKDDNNLEHLVASIDLPSIGLHRIEAAAPQLAQVEHSS